MFGARRLPRTTRRPALHEQRGLAHRLAQLGDEFTQLVDAFERGDGTARDLERMEMLYRRVESLTAKLAISRLATASRSPRHLHERPARLH